MSIDFERLWTRVRYAVMRARVTLVADDDTAQRLQLKVGTSWAQDKVPRMAEYGFQSVPPAGADAVVVCLGGDPSAAVVIATGHQSYRLQNLAPGEVAISDDKGQRVYLSADGIRIEGGTRPVVINASAGLTIHGPTVFDGTVTANGKRIDETHKHSGGTISGSTGVVS